MKDNPYAPPAIAIPAEVPDAPPDFGWTIENHRLIIEPGARLPMIDPFTGRDSEVMQLREMSLPNRPPMLKLLPPAVAVVAAAFGFVTDSSKIVGGLIAGALIGYGIYLLVTLFLPKCPVSVFVRPRTVRNRMIYDRVMFALLLGWVFSGFPVAFGPSWLQPLPGILASLWILGVAGSILLRRNLTCHRLPDGRFQVRGIHPRGIIELIRRL